MSKNDRDMNIKVSRCIESTKVEHRVNPISAFMNIIFYIFDDSSCENVKFDIVRAIMGDAVGTVRILGLLEEKWNFIEFREFLKSGSNPKTKNISRVEVEHIFNFLN